MVGLGDYIFFFISIIKKCSIMSYNYFYSQKKNCVYENYQELPFVGPQTGLEESFELVLHRQRSWPWSLL